ncbi:tape measure protein [Rhodococcus sp. CSLK01-03]|uniref:Tape measure protein n=1 Tax=Rhodococcus indonesiensis TaxID=3055869 RepID=A0ABT7RM42_9NOCA|nr:tape measure protein [Rhodococcus indonesiensis]MDM7488707.1 tape measure protein [Rhodococcus indonesiensis]
MATALGTALKGGALAAAGVATAGIAASLTKGWDRLTAIDDAKSKLGSLGHTTASTAKVMESALASVKGTSFGLGEAATIAASAVAAGVKPGEELTKYLSLTADVASVAGASLADVGRIINQTTTSGVVFTDSLNQLSDRGIPVFTWLQNEYKVTGSELAKMVEGGKVDAATFRKVLEENLGGAAKGGDDVSGALANVGAAMGRLGAAALEPTFNRIGGWAETATDGLDSMTDAVGPLAKALDEQIFTEWGPKVGVATEAVSEFFTELADSQLAAGSMDQVREIFFDLVDVGRELAPSILAIVSSLAQASAATGVSAWQVLLSTLDAIAPILNATLVPALNTLSELMTENQGAVTALMLGFAAFKFLPALGAAAAAAFAPLSTAMASSTVATAGARAGLTAMRTDFARLAPQIGVTGAAMRTLGTHSATIRGMQNAFIGSSTAAGGFAAAMRTGVAPALSGVASAARGLGSMLSGGLGIGLAIVAATQLISAADDLTEFQDHLTESSLRLSDAQGKVAEALGKSNGVINTDVMSALADQMGTYREELERTAAAAPGFWAETWAFITAAPRDGIHGLIDDAQQVGQVAEDTARALNEVGVSNEELAANLSGSDRGWGMFIEKLRETGGASDEVIANLEKQRAEFELQESAARNATPGFASFSEAVQVLADKSSDAEDKANALRTALEELLGIDTSAEEKVAKYEEAIDNTVAEAGETVAPEGGFGSDQLLNEDGGLNLGQANARALREEVVGLRNAYIDSVAAGEDAYGQYEKAIPALEALATKYGMTKEEVIEYARSQGMIPEQVETLIRLNGHEGVEAQLTGIAMYIANLEPGVPKEIVVQSMTEEAQQKLRELGYTVEVLPDGSVKVVANTAEAESHINHVTRDRTVRVRLHMQNLQAQNNRIIDEAARASAPGGDGYVRYADGGIQNLPDQAMIQPGRGAGLVQWAEGETGGEAFIPLSPSKRGRSTAILAEVADRFGMRLESYANGGIRAAMDAAYAGNGAEYVWGGTGPSGWDCSGWVGYIQQILMGLSAAEAAGTRLYTTYSLLGGSTSGLEPGAGPAGTAFVVGTSDEHMAASLNGTPLESGGAHGTSRIGPPAVGAFDSQFHSLFHLPNELIDGGVGGVVGADVTVEGGSEFGAQAARENPWTEKDQLDLESARISVQQAKEARDKVYADEKKSAADRAQADLSVQRAELKVKDLEEKRDGIGTAAISTDPAPPLTGDMSDSAIRVRQAEIAVLEAQLARDKVYNDPKSTSLDKEKADIQVHTANNSLIETRKQVAEDAEKEKNGSDGTGSGQFSLKDRIKQYGADVFGILVDAAIEQVSPFGESRWLSLQLPEFKAPKKGSTTSPDPKGSDERILPLADIPSTFPELNKQLGFNPAEPPEWIEKFLKKAPKVFDDGGWLMPGEMGINLSSRPEPIFNSPQQLLQFAGADLGALKTAAPTETRNDFSVHITNPTFSDGQAAVRAASRVQERQIMRYKGGSH